MTYPIALSIFALGLLCGGFFALMLCEALIGRKTREVQDLRRQLRAAQDAVLDLNR